MTRRRFYVPRDSIRGDSAALSPGEAHHLRDVLRMQTGDPVEILDDRGAGYAGRVEFHGSEVIIRDLEPIPSQPSQYHMILAAALIKSANFEWILQKATELGVDEIIPLRTHFVEIRIPDEKIEVRSERWQRIAREAAKQCRRTAVPILRKPLDFSALIAAEEFSSCFKILFYEKAVEPLQFTNIASDRILVCIGPEGGWDQGEVNQAAQAGYGIFGLGPWTLRAETAAIAAVAVVQHQLQLKSFNHGTHEPHEK